MNNLFSLPIVGRDFNNDNSDNNDNSKMECTNENELLRNHPFYRWRAATYVAWVAIIS